MILSLVLACEPGRTYGGVLVGNPGEVSLQTAATDGVELRSGSAFVESLILMNCEGEDFVIASGLTVDLLGGSSLLIPDGLWCSATLEVDGPLTWTGDLNDATLTLSVEPEPIRIWSPAGFITDEASLVMLLGEEEWLSDVVLEEADSALIVDDTHPLYDSVSGAIADGTSLYNTDEDGFFEDKVASGSGECDSGCGGMVTMESRGCGDNSLENVAFILFVPLLGLRRRHLIG